MKIKWEIASPTRGSISIHPLDFAGETAEDIMAEIDEWIDQEVRQYAYGLLLNPEIVDEILKAKNNE